MEPPPEIRPRQDRPSAHGIVRLARRPTGWIPPGPAAARPAVACELGPRHGEDLCHLSGDWRILQLVDGHRWSVDDLLTAWVARSVYTRATHPGEPANFLDLGCGIGSVLLMLAWCFPRARGVGIEAQEVSVDLARRSVRWNGAEERCEVLHADLRDHATLLADQHFDLITGTPPYLPRGHALESERPQWGPCHSEHRGGVEAYCATAGLHLTEGGAFVMCAAANTWERVERGASAAALQIQTRLDVFPRQGKGVLFSVFVLRRRPTALPSYAIDTLAVRDAAGKRTPAYLQVRHDMGLPP